MRAKTDPAWQRDQNKCSLHEKNSTIYCEDIQSSFTLLWFSYKKQAFILTQFDFKTNRFSPEAKQNMFEKMCKVI